MSFDGLQKDKAESKSAAIVTAEIMHDIDEALRSHDVTRRTVLAALRFSEAELITAIKRDRETAIAMAEVMAEAVKYAELLRNVADLMERANARIMAALRIREDYPSIFNETETLTRH